MSQFRTYVHSIGSVYTTLSRAATLPFNPCFHRSTLIAYDRGDIFAAEDQVKVDQHLTNCESCRQKLAEIEQGMPDAGHANYTFIAAGYLLSNLPEAIQRLPEEIRDLQHWELLDSLGEGGGGSVFLARHRVTTRLGAIKLVPIASGTIPGGLWQAERDQLPKAVPPHENVLSVELYGRKPGYAIFEMPYVFGSDLEQFARDQGGSLAPGVACALVVQAAKGLIHLHAHGVYHLDIKPKNLMVDRDDTVKIIDFGVARVLHKQPGRPATFSGSMLSGTEGYAAPEQFCDAETPSLKSDQFGLGCTLYRLIAGQPPSTDLDHDLALIRQRLTGKYDALIDAIFKMRSTLPAERFESVASARLAILPFADQELCKGTQEFPEDASDLAANEITKPRRYSPIWLLAAGASTTVIVLSLYFTLGDNFGGNPAEILVDQEQNALLTEDSSPQQTAPTSGKRISAEILYGTLENWLEKKSELVSISSQSNSYAGILFGDDAWTEYEFSFEFKCSVPPICTSAFVASTEKETTEFGLMWHNSLATISARNPTYRRLETVSMDRLEANQWYAVKVVVSPKQIQGFLDGVLMVEYTGTKNQSGQVGFLCYRLGVGEITRFRNIRVQSASGNVLWEGIPKPAI